MTRWFSFVGLTLLAGWLAWQGPPSVDAEQFSGGGGGSGTVTALAGTAGRQATFSTATEITDDIQFTTVYSGSPTCATFSFRTECAAGSLASTLAGSGTTTQQANGFVVSADVTGSLATASAYLGRHVIFRVPAGNATVFTTNTLVGDMIDTQYAGTGPGGGTTLAAQYIGMSINTPGTLANLWGIQVTPVWTAGTVNFYEGITSLMGDRAGQNIAFQADMSGAGVWQGGTGTAWAYYAADCTTLTGTCTGLFIRGADVGALIGGPVAIRPAGVTTVPAAGIELDVTGDFNLSSGSANQITFQESAATGWPWFIFRKSQGTVAAPADVASGDLVGVITAQARSSTTWFSTAEIDFIVDGTFTSGQRPPSRMDFYTNLANTAQTLAWRITSAGNWVSSGADPVLSACGTTPSIIGSNSAGKATIGTGVTTSCTLTFANAGYATNAPSCQVGGDNTAVIYIGTTTTTVLTITSSLDMASDVVNYDCTGIL